MYEADSPLDRPGFRSFRPFNRVSIAQFCIDIVVLGKDQHVILQTIAQRKTPLVVFSVIEKVSSCARERNVARYHRDTTALDLHFRYLDKDTITARSGTKLALFGFYRCAARILAKRFRRRVAILLIGCVNIVQPFLLFPFQAESIDFHAPIVRSGSLHAVIHNARRQSRLLCRLTGILFHLADKVAERLIEALLRLHRRRRQECSDQAGRHNF